MNFNLHRNSSRTTLYRNIKCCDDCMESTSVDMRKLAKPEHKSAPSSCCEKTPKTRGQSTVKEESWKGYGYYTKPHGTTVFSEASRMCRERKAAEHTRDCPYRRKCYQCRDLVVRVRSLLDEIKTIKKNKTAQGFLCDYCHRINASGRCKRCEFLANRYQISETIDEDARQQRFKIWLCKVKQFLNAILERETCKHKVYPRSGETDELTNLLHELKSPLTVREPEIGYFPSIDSLENITESKDILEQVLMRLKSHIKTDEKDTHSSCICKYFADKKFDDKSQSDKDSDEEQEMSRGKTVPWPTPESKFTIDTIMAKKYKDTLLAESKTAKDKSKDERKLSKDEKNLSKDGKYLSKDGKYLSKDEKNFSKDGKYHSQDGKSISKDGRKLSKDEKNLSKDERNLSKDEKYLSKDGKYLSKDEKNLSKDGKYLSKDENNLSKDGKYLSKDEKNLSKDGKYLSKDEKNLSKDGKNISKDGKNVSKDGRKLSKDEKNLSKDEKNLSKDEKNLSKDGRKLSKGGNKSPKDENKPSKDDNKSAKNGKANEDKKGAKDEPSKKAKHDSEQDLMAQMLKKNVTKRDEEKPTKAPPPLVLPKIEALPTPVRKFKEKVIVEPVVSESFAECDREDDEETEMIKGNRIVPIEPRKELDTCSVYPLQFKVQPECPSLPEDDPTPSIIKSKTSTVLTDKSKKAKEKNETGDKSGIVRYMLSNREFIDKGWTLLPTTKIMRRMNIYKMEPSHPKFDWFNRHKRQRLIYYDTGERFAEIDENGNGKWYYKNGALALDYYCAQDSNDGHRYVVYSSGENTDGGRRLPVTVLATFDYLGNGVVYDHYGNERLKYNQSEGVVIDEKIGPPGRWKWHTLNEPPVLQPVFVDNHVRPTGCLEKILSSRKDEESGSRHKKEPNMDMLAIELENFMKEKADKLLQEFKPFHIKMKACKVNDQFSLKVLDQASIYLLFRDGHTSVKLNLGMLLISNEIVDTDTSEVTQVATPFDRHPAKSESIADIQIALERARKLGKVRGKLRN